MQVDLIASSLSETEEDCVIAILFKVAARSTDADIYITTQKYCIYIYKCFNL